MHPNLRSFLDLLRRENELLTIEAEVDPFLELAEVHRRVIDRGGPALLFKRPKGSSFPVVTNLSAHKRELNSHLESGRKSSLRRWSQSQRL